MNDAIARLWKKLDILLSDYYGTLLTAEKCPPRFVATFVIATGRRYFLELLRTEVEKLPATGRAVI